MLAEQASATMKLLLLSCFLKFCLADWFNIHSYWLNQAKDCIEEENLKDRILIVTDKVTNNDSRIIDSISEEILQTTSGLVVNITDFDVKDEYIGKMETKSAFHGISHSNSLIVYFSRSNHSYAKLKGFYSSMTNGQQTLPNVITVDQESGEDDSRPIKTKAKLKCFEDNSAKHLNPEIQADLIPTTYIDVQGRKLIGPEGKIAQTLMESINATFSITKTNLRFKAIKDQSKKISMLLNLKKPTYLNSNGIKKADGSSWVLVYHPYRQLPLVPVLRCAWSAGSRLEFCLLAMVTIMIILMLHIMRRLMMIHALDKRQSPLKLIYKMMMPKSIMSGMEKMLFFCLVITFSVNLGFLVHMLFREKYGKDCKEQIERVHDLVRLNLSPITSLKECLHQMIEKKSKKVFCVVHEDIGKEIIKRYGNVGKQKMIRLVDSINFKFEWRGLVLDSPIHTERLNGMQMRFLESGLLEKWYGNEMMFNVTDQYMKMSSDLSWSVNDRQQERSRMFAYNLILMIFNGCLMAFIMFTGECIMHGAKVSEKRKLYIVYE